MQMRYAPLVLAIALGLSACGEKQETSSKAELENAVAVVNGNAISREEFDEYMGMKQMMQAGMPQNPDVVLSELVNMRLLVQAAEREKIDERADVQSQLERQRANLLINTLIREKIDALTFTEDQLKAEYDALMAEIPNQEYHARHILVGSEEEARAVIAKLDGGADFAELAKTESTGPSGVNGGDLGWFTASMMVPEFSEVVETLDKGTYTREPVNTQFGWHVILLEDTRATVKPSLEDVAQELEGELRRKFIEDYLAELRDAAVIETKLPAPALAPSE